MLKNPFGKFFRTIPILLLVLVSGCSPRAETTDFSLEEARVFKVTSFQVLNQITLGQAGMISFLNENEVVVADMCFPSLLSRINIQTGESNHFLKMGRGPGECIDINCLTVQDGKLFVFSPSSRKMIIMQESSEDKQVFSLEKEIQINENCLRMIPTKTGGFLGNPLHDGRFFLFDEAGAVVDTLGSFPKIEGDEVAINNRAFQSRFAFSPDGRKLCSGYSDMDFIEIYSDNFKKLKRLWGPEPFLPKAVRIINNGFISDVGEPHKQVFYMISPSAEGFLVGYVGHTYKDRDDPSRCTKEIFYFDWDGHFLARYILPEEVAFFDVDWKNARMCGVTAGVEAKLVVAQLEGLNELSNK